jgi:type IV pilus assembly protein PilX
MNVRLHSARFERGASLLVALVFLVVMAMLSVTLANVTTLEERMASGTRDRNLALQAAEAALRDAEVRLANPAFRATAFPAFVATRANDSAYWQTCFSTSAVPCNVTYQPTQLMPTFGPGAVATQPRYIVERKPNVGATEIYRVTARGFGGMTNGAGTPETVVVLQAEFGYTP